VRASLPSRCPFCREGVSDQASTCPRCRAPQLIDVAIEAFVGDARDRLAAAQALARIGPPGPTFLEAKDRLDRSGVLLAQAVPRPVAARIAEVAAEHGAQLSLSHYQPALVAANWPLRLSVAGGLALLLALGGWFFHRSAPTGVVAVSAPDAWTLARPVRPEPPSEPQESPGDRLLRASVTIRCGARRGYGFFVGEELLLAPARDVCPKGESQSVVLADGRSLLGTTESRDEALDLARIKVVGAAASALSVGDSTQLRPGTPLLFLTEPILSGVSRTVALALAVPEGGHALIQVSAERLARPGSALVDGQGRVVAMAVTEPEALGSGPFALPIEYAFAPEGPHFERWQEVLSQAAIAETDARRRLVAMLDEPYLAGVAAAPDGSFMAVFLRRPPGFTQPVLIQLDWEPEIGNPCKAMAHIPGPWGPVANLPAAARRLPRLEWMTQGVAPEEIWATVASLQAGDCPSGELQSAGRLALRAGATNRGQALLAAGQLAQAAGADAREQAAQQRRDEEARASQEQGQEAAQWRLAFRAAQGRVDALESQVRLEEEDLGRRLEVVEAERLRQRIARDRAELERARSDLHELERQAAFKAVPLEWRH
jgi:S1-C subfamily serine protease